MAENLAKSRSIESLPEPKRSFWGFLWLPTALILAVAAGALTGTLVGYYLNNSRASTEVSALATYRPPQVTKIYANDGETVLAEFAIEKRIPVKSQDIPPKVKEALVAIEDMRFYDHIGIDPIRLGGAMLKNITTGSKEGASTLTQQLAKNLFLYRDQTYTRKINEVIMSLEIERFYTKDQILEMYMNYVFLGANSYGFEAGARTYFNKTLKDLSLEEAALLAAIPKAPSEYSPISHSDSAIKRRNLVLDQMVKYGSISQTEADQAKAKPIQLADTAYYQAMPKSSPSDYPIEEVRKYLEDKYTTNVAQGGLTVYTTIDPKAQEYASNSVRQRLRTYDRSRGWRSEYTNILVNDNNEPLTDEKIIKQKLNSYKHPDWYGDEYNKEDYIKGLVVAIDNNADTAEIRFGKYKATVTSKDMGRSPKKSPKEELKVGNICEFIVTNVDDENKTLKVTLEQIPEVQAAIVCINAKNGEIVAMIGGYDFATSKFNNATQGLRQTGSVFKPFIYTAAVEWGMTPDMVVSGAPLRRGGWMPHNYDGSLSHANVPMKTALAKSYNLAAVHLLDQVGIQTGSQMVRRFGITNPMAPVLPSALGATEVSLMEMVSAYSAFPNKGVRVEPHLVRKVLDRDGKVLEEWEKTTYTVTSEYAASTMVQMMRAVVQGGGTATGASAGGHPLAGKTGTVNDHTDVWFIGYTPTYVTGVWMGNPKGKESLGAGMTGGHGAVPYFNSFMIPFMKDKPHESFSTPPPMPPEIKRQNELRKREEVEKLEKADAEGRRLGVSFNTGTRRSNRENTSSKTGGSSSSSNSSNSGITKIETNSTGDVPTSSTRNSGDESSGSGIKPSENKKTEPANKKPDAPPPSEPPKKKGKKGDDEKPQ